MKAHSSSLTAPSQTIQHLMLSVLAAVLTVVARSPSSIASSQATEHLLSVVASTVTARSPSSIASSLTIQDSPAAVSGVIAHLPSLTALSQATRHLATVVASRITTAPSP